MPDDKTPESQILKKLKSKEYRELAEAVRGGTLEGKVLETANQVTKNWKADLQAMTIGLARMKAVTVTKNLEVIIKVQDELSRRIDLKTASLGELATVLRILRDMNNEDVEFIHDLAFGKGEKLALMFQDNRIGVAVNAGREIRIQGGEVSQEGAERLRRLMDGLIDRINSGDRILEVGPRRPTDTPNT